MANPIKYKDLIVPDDSIENLLRQLTALSEKYKEMFSMLKSDAKALSESVKSSTAAMAEGQKKIQQASQSTDELARAQKNLQKAMADNAQEIAEIKRLQQEQTRINKLTVQLNNSAEGSYNKLSAQYSLNKIRLNAMSQAERENTQAGKELEAQTYKIYQRMIQLQEATGKHTLSVGNYSKAINGLNLATAQVLRELPALAISPSTFFLAISNNIPILSDQIQLLREQNKALIAEGKQGISIFKALGKSLLSWNTVLTLVVTAVTLWGEEMVDAIAKMFKSQKQIDILAESTKKYNEALLASQKAEMEAVTRSTILYNATQDTTRSIEERTEAAVALQQTYPKTFENFSTEEIMLGKASSAYKQLTNDLLENAKARAYLNKITEFQSQIIDKEAELQPLIDEIDKLEYKIKSISSAENQDIIGANIVQDSQNKLRALQKNRQSIENEITAIEQAIQKLEENIPLSGLADAGGTGGGRGAESRIPDELKFLRAAEDARIALKEEGMEKEIELNRVKYEREIEDLQITLKEEENLTEASRIAINETMVSLAEKLKMEEDAIRDKYAQKELEAEQKRLAEIAKAQKKAEEERQRLLQEQSRANIDRVNQEYDLRMSEIDILRETENEKTKLRLEAEKERLQKLIKLAESGGIQLGDIEIQTMRNIIERLNNEIDKNRRRKDLYDLFGLRLDDAQKDAIEESIRYAIDSITEIADAKVEAAQRGVDAAQSEVDSARSLLDAELEARANGYANNVAMAQKELDLAKKTQSQALAQQQRAQQEQLALESISQASSLTTAAAEIWAQLGFPWAIPAIAVMFGSFIAAKVKAAEVSRTVSYGDGTVELLEGGSHASGNDIDMGIKPDGTRRRAEGGEFFAIINKRNSRRYRNLIPDVIKSMNNGTFHKKYGNSYSGDISVNVGNGLDLNRIESDVRDIKKQNERKYIMDNGRTIMMYKNLKRVIK